VIVEAECVPCLLAVRLSVIARSPSESKVAKSLALLERALEVFKSEKELTKVSTKLYRIVLELSPEVAEAYKEARRRSIAEALRRLESFLKVVEEARGLERLKLAAKAAIAGNLADSGVWGHTPTFPSVEQVLRFELAIDASEKLLEAASRSRRALYLLDNAGEAVLDYVLVSVFEELGNEVVVAVKKDPGFQDDVTESDIAETPLSQLFKRVVSTGTSASSIHLEEVSRELLEELKQADFVVAKGMAHFEYLSELDLGKPVFFLLVPKCDVVARAVGAPRGSFALLARPGSRRSSAGAWD